MTYQLTCSHCAEELHVFRDDYFCLPGENLMYCWQCYHSSDVMNQEVARFIALATPREVPAEVGENNIGFCNCCRGGLHSRTFLGLSGTGLRICGNCTVDLRIENYRDCFSFAPRNEERWLRG